MRGANLFIFAALLLPRNLLRIEPCWRRSLGKEALPFAQQNGIDQQNQLIRTLTKGFAPWYKRKNK
jgi:hypothetical protein